MNVLDPVGIPSAPRETWQALRERLEALPPQDLRLILVTDSQGDRQHAAYAALVKLGHGHDETAVLSAPSFGPRYGELGAQMLAELVQWADQGGYIIRETVLSPGDFQRVLAEPDADEVAALIAASNFTDPAIYTTPLPKTANDW